MMVLKLPDLHVTRQNPPFHAGVIQHLLEGTHQVYCISEADVWFWMAVWMYLNDIIEGRA